MKIKFEPKKVIWPNLTNCTGCYGPNLHVEDRTNFKVDILPPKNQALFKLNYCYSTSIVRKFNYITRMSYE